MAPRALKSEDEKAAHMPTGSARPDDVRRQNRRAILQAIRAGSGMSRTDICAAAGLSQATVSAISTSLLSSGILREAEGKVFQKQRRGRPQVLLEANPSAGLVGALALTINGLAVELVDYSGHKVGDQFTPLDTLGISSAEVLDRIISDLRALVERRSDRNVPLRHITIGIQGVTNSDLGRMLWSPIMHERNVDFRAALSAVFGVPVAIDNDCNLIAEALYWSADFPFQEDFAALLLGRGIGMGLFLGGVRFHGTLSSAGEFGHMLFQPRGLECRCGALGCIEAYAGDYAIIGHAQPELRARALSGSVAPGVLEKLADAARAGDPTAIEAFTIAGEALGSGLASLFSITDPLPIAFVGEGAAALDLMEPAIHDLMATAAVRNLMGQPIFRTFPNEKQLILDGCSMTSLRYLDSDLFACSDHPHILLERAG